MMWIDVLFGWVCPSLGCIMAAAMFAAPVHDLREALKKGHLGSLNPLPWAVMTGNCLGWCAYGYYRHDPFVLASNLPGLVLSFWLNLGAAKLQYYELRESEKDRTRQPEETPIDTDDDSLRGQSTAPPMNFSEGENMIMVPQETVLLRILVAWAIVLVWVGWLRNGNEANSIGLVVNINLIFFYGAPLQTMQTVLKERCSDSIHFPTMVMGWLNSSFWMFYGVALRDPVIFVPNAVGLLLAAAQGALCLFFPRRGTSVAQENPLLLEDLDNEQLEDHLAQVEDSEPLDVV